MTATGADLDSLSMVGPYYFPWVTSTTEMALSLASNCSSSATVCATRVAKELPALYHWLVEELGDARVRDWPLMSSPWPTLVITTAYILLCWRGRQVHLQWRLGPHDQQRYLRAVIVFYNAVSILLNAYIFSELLPAVRSYNFWCHPVDYSASDAVALSSASALWWYYFSKLVEMLDSVFFLLKGNPRHLSFLHVYHHSSMFCLWWIGVKYVAGGSAVFGAFVNSVVHVVMYTYYLIAALGPAYRKYLGWKKYLTVLQICQFLAAIVMGINGLRNRCNFPLWMIYAMIFYMISFLILFGNFFYNTYIVQPTNKEKKDS